MSVSPGTYNFTVQRRADFSLALQFKDSTENPIDLTGATVEAQAWDFGRERKYADFAVAYTDRANGQVRISLTDDQTTDFPASVNYDVLVINSSGLRDYYLEGQITVSQGYTA